MLKIPFFRPLNAVVVPIHYEGHTHYFFCDTGVPFSFSKNLTYIPKSISPTKQPFPLKKPPFSLDGLSNSLGVEIAGFLGLDFFSSVPLFGIDFENHCLHFSDFSFKEQLTKPMIIPLLQGPVIMAQVGGQPPRPTFLDFGTSAGCQLGRAAPLSRSYRRSHSCSGSTAILGAKTTGLASSA